MSARQQVDGDATQLTAAGPWFAIGVPSVVISPEQYEQFQSQATREVFDTIREIHDRNRDADPDEIEAEIARAVIEVRQEDHAAPTTRRH